MKLGSLKMAMLLAMAVCLCLGASLPSYAASPPGQDQGQGQEFKAMTQEAHATVPAVAGMSVMAGVAMESVRRTRCKFRCETVKPAEYGERFHVQLRAQYESESNVPENERFSRYTPCGSFEATIENPALNDFFEPGREYFLDITPANPPE